jgi:AcrR family transcriptional regulator
LDASLDLIAQEGLEGFSIREVARRAGVSHQAPYHYFPDREAILAEIVAEGFQRLREEMVDAISQTPDDPAAQLNAIGRVYVSFALAHPAHFKLMFRSEMAPPERHANAKACADSAFDVLVEVANAAAIASGEAPNRALIFGAWSLVHGLSTLLLEGKLDDYFGTDEPSRRAAAEEVLQLFARTFSPRAGH